MKKARQIEFHEYIYRNDNGKLCHNGGRLTDIVMPVQDRYMTDADI